MDKILTSFLRAGSNAPNMPRKKVVRVRDTHDVQCVRCQLVLLWALPGNLAEIVPWLIDKSKVWEKFV